ncbi:GIY-YIG nuclease family protein [Mycolicibacterium sp.]|uniref:GIY-YIG nuclease family protein n=1 Tax=Mycolicibacterium sp. TaxID=2320850 RepID=UPI0037C51639
MYSWWADDDARAVLGNEVGVPVPHLIYVGQAGATKHRSGASSSATLASRIGRQHIRGNARSSTFRLTISSLLIQTLGLTRAAGGKLDAVSNARVSAWIAAHLRVAIAPVDDRDGLAELEKEVVTYLDPPLNLAHCRPSEARALISRRRRALGR